MSSSAFDFDDPTQWWHQTPTYRIHIASGIPEILSEPFAFYTGCARCDRILGGVERQGQEGIVCAACSGSAVVPPRR
jgi:DNA-directed RNA polymerase subunit RPC12/RpoP